MGIIGDTVSGVKKTAKSVAKQGVEMAKGSFLDDALILHWFLGKSDKGEQAKIEQEEAKSAENFIQVLAKLREEAGLSTVEFERLLDKARQQKINGFSEDDIVFNLGRVSNLEILEKIMRRLINLWNKRSDPEAKEAFWRDLEILRKTPMLRRIKLAVSPLIGDQAAEAAQRLLEQSRNGRGDCKAADTLLRSFREAGFDV